MANTQDYRYNLFHRSWRPVMAYTYALICLFDFLIAPGFTLVILPIFVKGAAVWAPVTLQGGQIFHTAFMAILGISSWARTKENVEDMRRRYEQTANNAQTANTVTISTNTAGP